MGVGGGVVLNFPQLLLHFLPSFYFLQLNIWEIVVYIIFLFYSFFRFLLTIFKYTGCPNMHLQVKIIQYFDYILFYCILYFIILY